MEPPKINGITLRSEIGSGATGTVYDALDDNGEECVVKVLDSMASNPALLENRVVRLRNGGAQDVTVPIVAHAFDTRPACVVMPLMAERLGNVAGMERFRPRNLQIHFNDFCQTENTWPFLLKLANRLAILHKSKVAHGNLKPGNVFIGPNGGPLLADYASGLMPGVHHLGYSDALLYSPPEQLRDPEAYLDEAGYQWDVYAFGVLSYRLLTGKFPRCHDTLSPFSPSPGTEEKFHVESDRESIAIWMESEPDVTWPDDPSDDEEARRREMINFCLGLDVMGRPSDMREVARYFESIEWDLIAEEESKRLRADRNKANKRRRQIRSLASLIIVVAMGLGAMWAITVQQKKVSENKRDTEFTKYRETSTETISGLEKERDETQSSLDDVLERESSLQESLANEQSQSQSEIVSAQTTNQTLFRWILEKGMKGYPTLEGRKERLSLLSEQIEEQLKGMSARPELAEQEATLRLRQAEVLLAMGNAEEGERALVKALRAENLPEVDSARAQVRLLLLLSSKGENDLTSRVSAAKGSVSKAWPDDSAERLRAEAAIDLVRARSAEDTVALDVYQQCLESYHELSKRYPNNEVLAMTLGKTYLAAAKIAEGEGVLDDVSKLRAEAAGEFQKLLSKQGNPNPELQYQIESATAARAIALWQEGKSFEAEKLAKESAQKLRSLLSKMPNDSRVIVDLASQQGILATFMRDEGNPTEAGVTLAKSIAALEKVIQTNPENWDARYLMASLKWQHAGILGQQGKKEEELKVGGEAHDELTTILKATAKTPHPATVRKSLAYLCGDLGHSADLAGEKTKAIGYLKEARECWKQLLSEKADDPEFREGHQWTVDRLAEMGVK